MTLLGCEKGEVLTVVEFQQLAALEWFAKVDNARTRHAYQNDLTDISSFI
ncbi:MAG: integrase, partial [Oxalobacteraceae bacterium]